MSGVKKCMPSIGSVLAEPGLMSNLSSSATSFRRSESFSASSLESPASAAGFYLTSIRLSIYSGS